MAVDRRTNRILVDVVRSRRRWQNGVWATERKISTGTNLVIRQRNLGDEETNRRSAWKVDVHVGGWRVLGHQGNHGRSHRREPKWRLARKNGPEEDSEGKMEMIVAVPWRRNEDTAKMDEGRLKGEVAMMDKDCKERLEMEEHGPVLKRT